jgi:hypothetical protein
MGLHAHQLSSNAISWTLPAQPWRGRLLTRTSELIWSPTFLLEVWNHHPSVWLQKGGDAEPVKTWMMKAFYCELINWVFDCNCIGKGRDDFAKKLWLRKKEDFLPTLGCYFPHPSISLPCSTTTNPFSIATSSQLKLFYCALRCHFWTLLSGFIAQKRVQFLLDWQELNFKLHEEDVKVTYQEECLHCQGCPPGWRTSLHKYFMHEGKTPCQ